MKRHRLIAGRWNTAGTTLHETIDDPQNVGVRWSMQRFGLERMEIQVKASSDYDMYDRYSTHIGQRMAIYTHWAHTPLSGFVSEVRLLGALRVLYIVRGPWWRMEDDLDTTVYDNTDDLQTTIKNILTDHVSVSDSDQSNIAANTTTIGGWQPSWPQGSYPGDMMADLLEMSDGSGNIFDFWFQDQPFNGLDLQDYLPYYAARSSSASVNWQVDRRDLRQLTPSRDIHELATSAKVYFGTITGTHTGSNNVIILTDSAATFVADGVQSGDVVTNITDGSRGKVVSVDSATQITLETLSGGTDDDFDTSDVYSIRLENPRTSQTSTVTADYWDRDVAAYRPEMTSTQATQYAVILKNTKPDQHNPFVFTAPFIRDGNGSPWPLWEVMVQGGGYVRINDLYPAASILSDSLDREQTFIITGLDYDHTQRSLRFEVDSPSRRLDARLRAAGILRGEMVLRG